jgi:putative heme transporter
VSDASSKNPAVTSGVTTERIGRRAGARTDPAGPPPDVDASLDVNDLVPKGLRVAAAFAWRLLVVAAALAVVVWLTGYLSILATTLAIALLLAALMAPAVDLLRRARFPRGLAAGVVLVAGLGFIGGLITFVIMQFTDGLPALQQQINQSLDQIRNWLVEGPLGLDTADIQGFIDQCFYQVMKVPLDKL